MKGARPLNTTKVFLAMRQEAQKRLRPISRDAQDALVNLWIGGEGNDALMILEAFAIGVAEGASQPKRAKPAKEPK